jgi:HlyD family secretion protein
MLEIEPNRFVTTRIAAPKADQSPNTIGSMPLRPAPYRRRRVVAVLVTVAAIAGIAFWLWSAVFSPVTVPTAGIQPNVLEQVFGLGVVGARIQSNIGFKVPGVLAALKADQGDRVQAGQVLAQLDARDIEAQLAVLRAAVAQARANIEKARADVASTTASLVNAKAVSRRRTTLYQEGVETQETAEVNEAAMHVAAANLAVAQSEVMVAQAALQAAQAQVDSEQAMLDYYTLYAPYDAWIVSRNLELGSMPNPGQSVFTLVATRTIWVQGYVDERLAGRLRVGQPAEIILRSNLAAHIAGHVERIEIQSDPVNEERLVDVGFDEIPKDIHLAEQAEVLITTAILAHAVAVEPKAINGFAEPLSDLDRRGNPRGWVWTVENGRLARRQVTFGPELLDGRLPIVGGLPPGAAVVAAPVRGLRVGRAAEFVRQ